MKLGFLLARSCLYLNLDSAQYGAETSFIIQWISRAKSDSSASLHFEGRPMPCYTIDDASARDETWVGRLQDKG